MAKRIFKVLMIISLLMMTGCATAKTKISTTAYPITYLVSKIGGDMVTVENISNSKVMQRATLVDNYQEILNDSMVLLHISGLEPYYDLYSNEISATGVKVLDLGLYASIYDYKRYTYVSNGATDVVLESDFYDNASFSTIDMYSKDCFLWIDAIAMTSMAKTIYEYLVGVMPESEAYFKRNYEKLVADLAILDAEYQDLRTQRKTIKLVTMTPSFNSWQKSYGVQLYPVILSKYGALPNELQLQAIKDRILADDVKYIAKENNMDEDMLALFEHLAEELDLEVVELDNLSALSEFSISSNEDYLKVMYKNLEVLESISE